MAERMSIIIPCHNEEASIERSLRAILDQRGATDSFDLELIVVLNGCSDGSRTASERCAAELSERGIAFKLLEVEKASKALALNVGEASARGSIRVYMDADVALEPWLLSQLYDALSVGVARYGTGTLHEFSDSWIVRAYGKAWRASPPIEDEVNGIGLYAVNAAGRRRWSSFPQIHSDDVFVRLQFEKDERVRVAARYHWPLPSSWLDLVKVRLRWTEGSFEVKRKYPELAARWRKLDARYGRYMLRALRMPISLAIFSGTYLLCRMLARRHVDTHKEEWRKARRSAGPRKASSVPRVLVD